MSFSAEDLAALDAAEEVEIETRSAEGEVHRTVIWPIVSGDRLLVRSYRGTTGRWYREALADPAVAILLGGRRLTARAVPVHDTASIDACSAGLERKYATSFSLRAMLVPEVLDTTLRLDPA